VVTLVATVTLDLTQAILIGGALSAAVFLNEAASIHVDVREVDPERMRQRGFVFAGHCPHVRVAYLTGPLFFAATGNFNESMAELPDDTSTLILSMRAVPTIDLSGLEALEGLHARLRSEGKTLLLSGLQPQVEGMLERSGLLEQVGREGVFWSADRAILAAEERAGCTLCGDLGGPTSPEQAPRGC
jgi:SulP family sulfate permease